MRAKKYLFAGLLLLVLLFGTCISVYAADEEVKSNGEYQYQVVESQDAHKLTVGDSYVECGTGIYLLKYLGDQAEVVVPDEIDGLPVTTIAPGCFAGNDVIEQVEIPGSVIWLGGFGSCSNLKQVKLSDGLRVIDDFAFEFCESIESITLPDSVVSIGTINKQSNVFSGCKKLSAVTLSENIRFIGGGTFENCISLKKIVIPEKVTYIRDYSFSGCSSLEEARLQGSVKKIGTGAFQNCSSLKSINLPDTVANIMARAFWGCSSLKNIQLSKDLQTIYALAFQDCSSLEKIVIPSGVQDIGAVWMGKSGYVFSGCTSLKSVTIKGQIQTLRKYTFEGCKALKTVKLPSSLTKIGEGAFIRCTSMKTITIPANVKRICKRAFAQCPSLSKVVFKSSKTKVGQLAFKGTKVKAGKCLVFS